MAIEWLLIDLDETVYSPDCGLWDELRKRMERFMHENLSIPEEQIPILRNDYFAEFGTTLRGLQRDYGVSAQEYLAYVHDVPLEKYLARDPDLIDTLMALPQRKCIFTNADQNHARRVLDRIGIAEFFEKIIDVNMLEPYCKPYPQAYHYLLHEIGDPAPSECMIADDSPRNLHTAHELGMIAVLVHPHCPQDGVPYQISRLHELPKIIDQIENEQHTR